VPKKTNVDLNSLPSEPGAELYYKEFEEKFLPHWNTAGVSGVLITPDKTSISYHLFKATSEKGAVVVLPGRAECYLKHPELVWDLKELNLTVYLLDHRGQGLSSRTVLDCDVGHVEKFSDYVDDLSLFFENIVSKNSHKKVFLLGHSMGGLVAVHFAARQIHRLDGIVLTAPLFKMLTGLLPNWLAYFITTLATFAGFGTKYGPGQTPFNANITFENNYWTRCRHRFENHIAAHRKNRAINIGEPSNQWIREIIRATWGVTKLATKLPMPTLLFQAGYEIFVSKKAHEKFRSSAPNCQLISFENAWHELLSERDDVRQKLRSSMNLFFSSNTL
jgi:lysophospholipase